MADLKPLSHVVSGADAKSAHDVWQEQMRQRFLWEKEQLQRGQAQLDEPYYDPKLAAEIVARMGPGFAPSYNPSVKHFVQTPYQPAMRGITSNAPQEDIDATRANRIPVASDDGLDVYLKMQPRTGHVYNFSPQPRAKTFAHEYRHRAGVLDEYNNRIYDAMYSQTPEDWEDSVMMYQDYRNADRYDTDLPDLTREEAEAALLETLRNPILRENKLRAEYAAAPEDQKPYPLDYQPDVLGFISEAIFRNELNSEPQYVYGTHLPFEKAVEEIRRRDTPQGRMSKSLIDAFKQYQPR